MDKDKKTPESKEIDKTKSKKPVVKKEKYDGPRWSSLILFLVTILAGVAFYLTGEH